MCAYNLNKNMLNTTIKYTPMANHYSNVRNNLSFHIDSFPFLRASACSLSTIHYMQVSNWWRYKPCLIEILINIHREMSFFIFFFHNCVLLNSIISIVHSIRAFHSNSFMINIVYESGEEQNKSGYINCYVKVNPLM